jgi:hypothetical protein
MIGAKSVHSEMWSTFGSTFPVIDTTDLWGCRRCRARASSGIGDEFDVVRAHQGLSDIGLARRGYRRIYRHVPKTWRSHTRYFIAYTYRGQHYQVRIDARSSTSVRSDTVISLGLSNHVGLK